MEFYAPDAVFPGLARTCARSVKAIRTEVMTVWKTTRTEWADWPETALYSKDKGDAWNVLPFVHTFPGNDPSKTTWVPHACALCPVLTGFLQGVPDLRTALVSVMSPNMQLKPHRGWASLSNHVLRCHLPLVLPEGADADGFPWTGVVVQGKTQFHTNHDLIVFDDSMSHFAFNTHATQSRIVLIFDIARPHTVPVGTAVGDCTEELLSFMDFFK